MSSGAAYQSDEIGKAHQRAAASAQHSQLPARRPALITAGAALRAAGRAARNLLDRPRDELRAFAKQLSGGREHARALASLDRPLRHDPAGIELGRHEVYGDAERRYAMQQRLKHRIDTLGLRQQRGMDVEAAVLR